MNDMRQWLSDGKHLPSPLRDFHDQKDLFKSLHEWIGKPVAPMYAEMLLEELRRDGCAPELVERVRQTMRISWVDGQCYVVDYVLRFLAAHGWTLQRCRADVEFIPLDETIKARRDREATELREALSSARASGAEAGGHRDG